MLEAKVRGISYRAVKEGWPYPQIFNALKSAGVRYYEVDVCHHIIRYVALSERYVADPPNNFQVINASLSFNQDAIKKAIYRAQMKAIDYTAFLHAIAEAGVIKYRVNMMDRTINYMGSNDQYIEEVPGFCADNMLHFTSDASIDFTPTDFNAPLTSAQQQYIKEQTGYHIKQMVWCKQVHGDVIGIVEDKWLTNPLSEADAFITTLTNTPIAVRTADCVPVFLKDPVKRVIAVVHAGWKGTEQQITLKTVNIMKQQFNCDPSNIQVVIGPSGRVCCYEVGQEFRAYFPQDVHERDGKLYADVAGNNVRQLRAAGVLAQHIESSHECTICNPQYFSYRRDGVKAGRMISFVMLVGDNR